MVVKRRSKNWRRWRIKRIKIDGDKGRRFPIFLLFLFIFLGFAGISSAFFVSIFNEKITKDDIVSVLKSMPKPTYFYSRNGEIIGEFAKNYFDEVKYEEIPRSVVYAVLSAEDEDFFKHKGISLKGIIRAAIKNIQKGRLVYGGSTITQQLARNLFLGREKTIERKLKEIKYALLMEKYLTKEEIFSLYISTSYFGHGAWGIKSAAKKFFRKELKDLTIGESALLAGLLKSPVNYSPINYPERARERQMWVIKRMFEEKFISKEEYEKSINEKFVVFNPENEFEKYFWFSEEVRRWFVKNFGENALYSGYKVWTTLDERCYKSAESALKIGLERVEILNGGKISSKEEEEKIEGIEFPTLKKIYKKEIVKLTREDKKKIHPDFANVNFTNREISARICFKDYLCPVAENVKIEGAIAVISTNGEVLCIIGGYSPKRSQFIRATQSKRPLGSAVKPIIYLTAINSGMFTPATLIEDTPVVYEYNSSATDEQDFWAPKNFDRFEGYITLQEALAKSKNNATIRVAEKIGIKSIKEMFQKLKIQIPEDLTVALGTVAVSPLEAATIYSIFPNLGEIVKPIFVTKVEDENGKIVYEERTTKERVVEPEPAFVLLWMLRNVVLYGTGWRAKSIGIPVAGKTGTSNDSRDMWFIGFTPNIVVAVWVGKDDFSPIDGIASSGPSAAVPIFTEFMLRYKPQLKEFQIPAGVEFLKVDPIKGILSSDGYTMAFIKGTAPENQNENGIDENENEIEW